MAVPTYAQLITLSSSANGLVPEALQERLLTIAAMLASGTGPDGTALPGPAGAGVVLSTHARRTAGNVTVSATTFGAIDTATDLTVAAAVGDILEYTVNAIVGVDGTNTLVIAAATLVGSTVTNSLATGGAQGTAAPWNAECFLSVVGEVNASFSVQYTVVAGDISSGNVTVRALARVTGGAGETIGADGTNRAFSVSLKNLKH